MIAHGRGDGDAARRRNALKPCRHIDAVAKYVVAFHDHVAMNHAGAELDASLVRHADITLAPGALDVGRAGDRVHHARELDQDAVTGQLYDAPPMFSNLGVRTFSTSARDREFWRLSPV